MQKINTKKIQFRIVITSTWKREHWMVLMVTMQWLSFYTVMHSGFERSNNVSLQCPCNDVAGTLEHYPAVFWTRNATISTKGIDQVMWTCLDGTLVQLGHTVCGIDLKHPHSYVTWLWRWWVSSQPVWSPSVASAKVMGQTRLKTSLTGCSPD